MTNCFTLTRSINNDDCDNPIIPGVDAKIWVFPLDRWENAAKTVDGTDTNLITNIVMASGELGIFIQGQFSSVEPTSSLSVQTFGTTYLHQILFRVFDNSPKVKQELERIAKGKFVVVVQNNFKGTSDDVAFEIYGYNSGMRATEGPREVNNVENLGAYVFTLVSEETATEPRLPFSLLVTDVAGTLTLLNSIVTPTLA